MTTLFNDYVNFYKRIAHTDTVDAAMECALAIWFVSDIMATEHLILYGTTSEFKPTRSQIVSAIRECCGDDVYKRMFVGDEG